jgi:integrase
MSGKILSWSPNWSKRRGGGGRWRKIVGGKAIFFGHGISKADTKSYREAERRYLEFQQRRERQEPIQIAASEATVFDVAEKFVQIYEGRHNRGEISTSHFCRVCGFIQRFVDFVGQRKKFSTIMEISLSDFREHVLSQPPTNMKSPSRGKPMSMATARELLYTVKKMYLWAYELRLCEMPRNLGSFTRCVLPKPVIKTYTIDEVRTLWAAADDRLKCFMALALNGGYGQKDISDLRHGEIHWDNGVIDRARSKSGIRQRHKLWPVTLDLLKKYKREGAAAGDRLFVGADGNHLVHDGVVDGVRKKADAVKCLFWRVQRKTGINGGRGFYCLRKTAATEIEKINPLVTEMFLAHTEKGMKRHYAERAFGLLDEALEEMEGTFGLVLPVNVSNT